MGTKWKISKQSKKPIEKVQMNKRQKSHELDVWMSGLIDLNNSTRWTDSVLKWLKMKIILHILNERSSFGMLQTYHHFCIIMCVVGLKIGIISGTVQSTCSVID